MHINLIINDQVNVFQGDIHFENDKIKNDVIKNTIECLWWTH